MSTISKSGISPAQIIKSEHLIRIIDALDGTSTNDIIISGSLVIVSGSISGDGSGLTNITGEWDGTLDGNAEITGSLIVTDTLTIQGDTIINGDLFVGEDNNPLQEVSVNGVEVISVINNGVSPTSIEMGEVNTFNIPVYLMQNDSARITLHPNSNIGINNTSPSYKLDVTGDGRFTSDLTVGTKATIGYSHTNTGTLSSIGGGTLNKVIGNCSFIGGGNNNISSGSYDILVGGYNNKIEGIDEYYDVLSTTYVEIDFNNGLIEGDSATFTSLNTLVVPGDYTSEVSSSDYVDGYFYMENSLEEEAEISDLIGSLLITSVSYNGGTDETTIEFGDNLPNPIQSNYYPGNNFIGGGNLNIISGSSLSLYRNVIVGGCGNVIINSNDSFIGGGRDNCNTGNSSIIGGGYCNYNTGTSSTIGGGEVNYNTGGCSTIGGGCLNCNTGFYSTIGGGYCNYNTGAYSTIGGGYCNYNTGACSTIGGGSNNILSHDNSFIIGSNITSDKACTTFMNNVHITGSTTTDGILQLSRRDITPTGVEGMIISSGSAGASKLYYYDGSTWNALF